ncbi:MAG: YbbR-like domain-containing protein [Christensenellales bacterium]|jgi:YbbR domain-containing protein
MIKYMKLFFRLIRKNWGLKLVAVFFAVLVWSLAWSDQNPIRNKALPGIPVNIIGEQALADRRLMLADSLEGIADGVEVGVEVRQRDYGQVTPDKVTASIDVSTIMSAGTHEVKLKAETSQLAGVKTITPGSIEVFVDEIVSKQITVSYTTTEELPEGYWHGVPEISPNVITIRGAKTDVERIASAQCVISLGGLTESIWQAVNISLLDGRGAPVSNLRLLDSLPSVIVKMDVMAYKDVEIDTRNGIVGRDALAAGYEVSRILVQPEMVRLIGDEEILQGIDQATIEPVDVSGQDASMQVEAKLVLPEGVRSADGNSVLVRVDIRQKQEQRTIENRQVEIRGTPAAGQVLTTDVWVAATIQGAEEDVRRFLDDNLVLYVNVDALAAGTHSLAVQYRLEGSIVPDEIVANPEKVTVRIG